MRVGFAGLGRMGLPLPVATAARRALADACAAGFADADFSCVARLLRPSPRMLSSN